MADPWTPMQEATLRRLVRQRLDDHIIGERMGRTPRSINGKRFRLGLVTVREVRIENDTPPTRQRLGDKVSG